MFAIAVVTSRTALSSAVHNSAVVDAKGRVDGWVMKITRVEYAEYDEKTHGMTASTRNNREAVEYEAFIHKAKNGRCFGGSHSEKRFSSREVAEKYATEKVANNIRAYEKKNKVGSL